MGKFLRLGWMASWRLTLVATVIIHGKAALFSTWTDALWQGWTNTLVPAILISLVLCILRLDVLSWPLFNLFTGHFPLVRGNHHDRIYGKKNSRNRNYGTATTYRDSFSDGEWLARGSYLVWNQNGYEFPARITKKELKESSYTEGAYKSTGTFSILGRPSVDRVAKSSLKCSIPGWKFKELAVTSSPLVHGTPGSGLNTSSFGSDRIAAGQKGETNFAKALSATTHKGSPLISLFDSYWSVAMPEKDKFAPDPKLNTDIDCILIFGKTVMLIDLKLYKSGNVTFESFEDKLYTVDNATGKIFGEPHRLSQNMAIAKERFNSLSRGAKVESYVVLMPTENGQGTIGKTAGWPDHIRAVTMDEMLSIIKRKFDSEGSSNQLNSSLLRLVK